MFRSAAHEFKEHMDRVCAVSCMEYVDRFLICRMACPICRTHVEVALMDPHLDLFNIIVLIWIRITVGVLTLAL